MQGVYFGGIPTKPFVQKLREKYPTDSMKPGVVATLAEIAEVVGESPHSNRFKTIISVWRRDIERDTSIETIIEGGNLIVLDDKGKLAKSKSKQHRANRQFKKSVIINHKIDAAKLSETERKELHFINERSAKILAISQIRKADNLPSLT
jgi:hypothetical protein